MQPICATRINKCIVIKPIIRTVTDVHSRLNKIKNHKPIAVFIATVDTFMNKNGGFMTKTSKFNLVIALNALRGPKDHT